MQCVLVYFAKARYLINIKEFGLSTPEALLMQLRSYESKRSPLGHFALWALNPPDISRQEIPEIGKGYGEAAIILRIDELLSEMGIFACGQLCAFDKYMTRGTRDNGKINSDRIVCISRVDPQSWKMEPKGDRAPKD